jgi:AAA+ superfamily predicted ATPase
LRAQTQKPLREAFTNSKPVLPYLRFAALLDVLVSSLLGETASNLKMIFDHASAQPVVLLLDESDAIARLRDDETLNGDCGKSSTAY